MKLAFNVNKTLCLKENPLPLFCGNKQISAVCFLALPTKFLIRKRKRKTNLRELSFCVYVF